MLWKCADDTVAFYGICPAMEMQAHEDDGLVARGVLLRDS